MKMIHFYQSLKCMQIAHKIDKPLQLYCGYLLQTEIQFTKLLQVQLYEISFIFIHILRNKRNIHSKQKSSIFPNSTSGIKYGYIN